MPLIKGAFKNVKNQQWKIRSLKNNTQGSVAIDAHIILVLSLCEMKSLHLSQQTPMQFTPIYKHISIIPVTDGF